MSFTWLDNVIFSEMLLAYAIFLSPNFPALQCLVDTEMPKSFPIATSLYFPFPSHTVEMLEDFSCNRSSKSELQKYTFWLPGFWLPAWFPPWCCVSSFTWIPMACPRREFQWYSFSLRSSSNHHPHSWTGPSATCSLQGYFRLHCICALWSFLDASDYRLMFRLSPELRVSPNVAAKWLTVAH